MDRHHLAGHLIRSAQAIHQEDERIGACVREVRATGQIGPAEYEALAAGIRAANRLHAGTLLMLATFLEAQPAGIEK